MSLKSASSLLTRWSSSCWVSPLAYPRLNIAVYTLRASSGEFSLDALSVTLTTDSTEEDEDGNQYAHLEYVEDAQVTLDVDTYNIV